MRDSSFDSNSSVSEREIRMPPTLNIGVSSIHPSVGLSVQLQMPPPWENNCENSSLPNGSSSGLKDIGHQIHGQMSVNAENFTFRGVDLGLSRPFVPSSGLSNNNGPSILPVPNGYTNRADLDEYARIRAMQLSRPHEMAMTHEMAMSGFPAENSYPVTSFTNSSLYAQGADNVYIHSVESHTGYMEGDDLRDEQSAAFAMYRFKVEKCSKQFVHDWKECPYAHEGETARRRHPSTHSAQPCPEFKNSKSCARCFCFLVFARCFENKFSC